MLACSPVPHLGTIHLHLSLLIDFMRLALWWDTRLASDSNLFLIHI